MGSGSVRDPEQLHEARGEVGFHLQEQQSGGLEETEAGAPPSAAGDESSPPDDSGGQGWEAFLALCQAKLDLPPEKVFLGLEQQEDQVESSPDVEVDVHPPSDEVESEHLSRGVKRTPPFSPAAPLRARGDARPA